MSKRKIKIAFIANTGWYFYNYKNNLINFLYSENYEIYLICPRDQYSEILRKDNINVLNWELNRSSKIYLKN